jgi:hypothetical protein
MNMYQAVATRYASGIREFFARIALGRAGDLLPLPRAAGAPRGTKTGLVLGRDAAGGKARGSRRIPPRRRRLPRGVCRAGLASHRPFDITILLRQREQVAQGARLAVLALREGSAAFHGRQGPQFLFD